MPLSLERGVLSVARAQLGLGETTANNRGEYLIQIRRGIDDASPWCAAAVSYVYEEAALMVGKSLPPPLKRSHGAKRLALLVSRAGRVLDLPDPGGVVCWHRGDPTGWQGHIGIIEAYDPATDWLTTLEGNRGSFPSAWRRYEYQSGAWRKDLFMIATTKTSAYGRR